LRNVSVNYEIDRREMHLWSAPKVLSDWQARLEFTGSNVLLLLRDVTELLVTKFSLYQTIMHVCSSRWYVRVLLQWTVICCRSGASWQPRQLR